jgi:hypothetical protein
MLISVALNPTRPVILGLLGWNSVPIPFGGIFQVQGRGANSPLIAVRQASMMLDFPITSVMGAERFPTICMTSPRRPTGRFVLPASSEDPDDAVTFRFAS